MAGRQRGQIGGVRRSSVVERLNHLFDVGMAEPGLAPEIVLEINCIVKVGSPRNQGVIRREGFQDLGGAPGRVGGESMDGPLYIVGHLQLACVGVVGFRMAKGVWSVDTAHQLDQKLQRRSLQVFDLYSFRQIPNPTLIRFCFYCQ